MLLLVPVPPTVTISPSGPIQGAMVGSPQMIYCIANTTTVLDVNMVMFSWFSPEGEAITNDDSRVTINPTTSSGNNYTSSIQFTYLMEGDEGTYTCNVTTFGMTGSALVALETLNGNLLYICCICCAVIKVQESVCCGPSSWHVTPVCYGQKEQ